MLDRKRKPGNGQAAVEVFSVEGVQPDHQIRAAIGAGIISAERKIESGQIQAASLDLRLGDRAWRLRAGFLPGGTWVEARAERAGTHQIMLSEQGTVLEPGCMYLVPLMEKLLLPAKVRGQANPKSSIGRMDVFTRLVCDHATRFDMVPEGYCGPLYAEISPRTFPVLVRPGERLCQMRFITGEPKALRVEEIALAVPSPEAGIAGYRARRHAGFIDLARTGAYDREEYWEEVRASAGRYIVLDPNEFYILVSDKAVRLKSAEAAEMLPVAPELGEFRAHYAGFFDPGFGMDGEGSKAVLEVRSRDTPFILEHGQIVARLEYWPMSDKPRDRYGKKRKSGASSYQGQGLRLAKYFRQG